MNTILKTKTTLLFLLFATALLQAQNTTPDSIRSLQLKQVTVKGYRNQQRLLAQLPDVQGTYLNAGKKNEVINVQELPANLTEKTARQIFAKIPGAFVYDMDGSGNQVNIATRGLDPHRSWEYNIRQNGVVVNSDLYGYPASHYSMPMESIERIEMVRGSAALQYGATFGGMINYVTKQADTTRRFSFESINAGGSFGLASTYNAIGGKIGKFQYYAYAQYRQSDGYRNNGRSQANSQFARLQYDFSKKFMARVEFGRSNYRYRLPGPLTDSMFYADPRQATRSRNFYSPDIYVPSVTLEWKINNQTTLNLVTSAVLGTRSSVLFDNFANVPDKVIDPVNNLYKSRFVDIDQFHSYTSELRLLHHYQLGGRLKSVFAGGMRYINNDLHRRQRGPGTGGTDYDLSITGPFARDLHYLTQNVAFFAENLIYLTPKWSVSPGVRFEQGVTRMTGYLSYLDPAEVPNTIKHHFPLFGITSEYKPNSRTRIYGGIVQAYRPALFKDIIPTSILERANKNLKDGQGYNAELGISSSVGNWLKFDITLFQLLNQNRLGNSLLTENGKNYIYKTNIGNSMHRGVEFNMEATAIQHPNGYISVFTSTSYLNARYQNASIAAGDKNINISGNRVESAPQWISRNGLQMAYKSLAAVLQYSYVASTFADPLNTVKPSANGAVGLVPAYGIWDFNSSYRFNSRFQLKLSINNLTNLQYFTKRPLFYPGPGIWSSDGRSVVVSFGIKL
jgi:Fe(3+) dicitrate transport protein